MIRNIFKISAFILAFQTYVFAQFNDFHPQYDWFTIKGEHVVVHFHNGAERTARVVVKIADEVWEPITNLYDYKPDIVHFVIKDIDDYSNGATYFFDNKIEIWASALDFDLRGSKNWLRNVITHEFTHMVQIQSAMKLTRSIPAFYLQYLNYEDKRRPDILYGFPNFIASYPVPSINIPAWFAEGTAQYQRPEFGYENWDSHRDMILRSYALDGKMLSWNQMGVFGKTSLGNESVYNAGYALTRYIAQKYGEDKLRKISKDLGKIYNFTIDAAFEDVLNKTGTEIYDEWQSFLVSDYKSRTAKVSQNLKEGEIVGKSGFGNFYPVFSIDGSKLIYISNKEADYFGLSGIYQLDLKSGEEKQLVGRVNSTIDFVDNNRILYAQLTDDNPNFANTHDIFIYDITKDDDKRITKGLRANSPSVSHSKNKVAFVFQKDGTSNIGIVDIDGKNFKQLTFYKNGEQVFNPKFSPDDSYIIFSYCLIQNRDIAKVSTEGSDVQFLLREYYDERDPVFGPDGRIYYSSDETGIYNIYSVTESIEDKRQLTNVLGGAFMPSVSGMGEIAYAGYTSSGYKIFTIEPDEQKSVDASARYIRTQNPPLGKFAPNGDIANYDLNKLKKYNDSVTPEYEKKKYSGSFSKISFFPFIRYDNYTGGSMFQSLKPGVYVSSFDMLNRMSFFGGASVNSRMERDLFLIFEYRDKIPLLYSLGLVPALSLELYSISRKSDVDISFGADSTSGQVIYDAIVPTDVTYNLFEVDIAAKQKVFNNRDELEFRFVYSSYMATLGSFILPDGNNTLYPTTNDTYFIGRDFRVKFTHKDFVPNVDRDINPIGRKVEFVYDYEFNQFNNEGKYTVEDGILKPLYSDFNFHKVELNWEEHVELLKSHTLTARFRAGSILGPTVPDFFDFYLGGLIGMKSYPFYAISGNEIGWLNLTYRLPLLRNIDKRFGIFYLDKIYFSVYGDLGNAWNGNIPSFDKFKRGAGMELRIKLNSFYLFPTSLFFNAAYSFDKFTRQFGSEEVNYGKEWRFYGGILFDFNI